MFGEPFVIDLDKSIFSASLLEWERMDEGDTMVIGGTPRWADSLRNGAGLVHLGSSPDGYAVEGTVVRRPAGRALPYPSEFFRRVHCDLTTGAHLAERALSLAAPGGTVMLGPVPRAESASWLERMNAAGLTGAEKDGTVIGRKGAQGRAGDADCVFCARYRFRMNADAGVPGAAGVLWGDDDLWCVPDLAPLRQGHLLLVSTAHHPCFGACPPELLGKLAACRALVTGVLTSVYGVPVTFFEHGPATSQGAGACIDHAHLHCVPGLPSLRGRVEAEGLRAGPYEVTGLYRRRTSYLYVEDEAGPAVYPCRTPLPSQFLRKAAAGGRPWRWQETYGTPATRELFLATLRALLPWADRLLSGQADSSHRSSAAVTASPNPMDSGARS